MNAVRAHMALVKVRAPSPSVRPCVQLRAWDLMPLAELGWLAAQALEARGYDSEMAKLALEQVDYQSEDHAAMLLDEWNGGPPAPAIGGALPRSGSALTGASEAEEERDDGYDGDGDDDDEQPAPAPSANPRSPTPPGSPRPAPPAAAAVDRLQELQQGAAALGQSLTHGGSPVEEEPSTPPPSPTRTPPPLSNRSKRTSDGSRPASALQINLPGESAPQSRLRSAGAQQRQRYAEVALGLAEWDVIGVAAKLGDFLGEVESGQPVDTVSLRLDPAQDLEPEPEPDPEPEQETDPLEDLRSWLTPLNLLAREKDILAYLAVASPLKDLADMQEDDKAEMIAELGFDAIKEGIFRRAVLTLRENGGKLMPTAGVSHHATAAAWVHSRLLGCILLRPRYRCCLGCIVGIWVAFFSSWQLFTGGRARRPGKDRRDARHPLAEPQRRGQSRRLLPRLHTELLGSDGRADAAEHEDLECAERGGEEGGGAAGVRRDGVG